MNELRLIIAEARATAAKMSADVNALARKLWSLGFDTFSPRGRADLVPLATIAAHVDAIAALAQLKLENAEAATRTRTTITPSGKDGVALAKYAAGVDVELKKARANYDPIAAKKHAAADAEIKSALEAQPKIELLPPPPKPPAPQFPTGPLPAPLSSTSLLLVVLVGVFLYSVLTTSKGVRR